MLVCAGCVISLGRCLRLNILTTDLATTDDIGQVEHPVLDIRYTLILLLVLE